MRLLFICCNDNNLFLFTELGNIVVVIVTNPIFILPWAHENLTVKFTMSNVDVCAIYMHIGCLNCPEHFRIVHGCCFTHTIWEMMHCMLGNKCMNNQQAISLKSRARCYAMLPTACNAFRPIPGLINCAGVTGRWKLLSYAQNVVRWLALFLKVGRSCLKVLSLF